MVMDKIIIRIGIAFYCVCFLNIIISCVCDESSLWAYECDGTCQRKLKSTIYIPMSLETCNMMCSYPQIWPKPKSLNHHNKSAPFVELENIQFNIQPTQEESLSDMKDIFLDNLERLIINQTSSRREINRVPVLIDVYVHDSSMKLTLDTDESYNLTTRNNSDRIDVQIIAVTSFGVRHALETLSQIIWWDSMESSLRILTDVEISDKPEFPYRGLMVDTARNFFSLELLKKIINGMSASKLNVLHLHLTDIESFPVLLPRVRSIGENGAYSSSMVYTATDLIDLRKYAKIRGIRLVLEVDAPGHINIGWNFYNNRSNQDYVVMNDQLNPDNNDCLDILEKIYTDLLEISGQNEIFHIGGDEVDTDLWKYTEAAQNYSDVEEFQVKYMNEMINKLKTANNNEYPKNIILWSSSITNRYDLIDQLTPSDNIVVQFWLGDPTAVIDRFKVIYSTVSYWYLDCGFGPWNRRQGSGICDPYKSWRTIYGYSPWMRYDNKETTLGGEVCLWSELVSEDDLETRVFPRASAFAERVWSDPPFLTGDVYTRLDSHENLLRKRGLRVAGMWPRWCSYNPDLC